MEDLITGLPEGAIVLLLVIKWSYDALQKKRESGGPSQKVDEILARKSLEDAITKLTISVEQQTRVFEKLLEKL